MTVRVLFVAADENRCAHAARGVERIADGVEMVGATSVGGVRAALTETRIDCLVFAENPLTAEGARLDAVAELCGAHSSEVPIVLFTDGTYGPSTAKATDSVADYVRSEAEGAYEHLADRIHWNTTDDAGGGPRRYEAMVESMDDAVLVFEGEAWIRYANDAMAAVFGLDEEGVRFRDLADRGVVSEADARAVTAAVESVAVGETNAHSVEVTIDPADADARVAEFQVVPLPGDDGVLATARNVTEYKQAESALEATQSKIERLHAVTDEMGACRSERELFERTVEAIDRVLDPDVCGVEVVEDDHLVPRATGGGEYGPTPRDEGVGGRALATGTSILVEDAEGTADAPVDGAHSVLCVPVDGVALLRAVSRRPGAFGDRDRDLAELLGAHVGESLTRIRVGRTLRRRERDLIEERERLVALFENVPSPVVGYGFEDGDPVVRDANPSFEATFGVDVDRAVSDPLHDHVRPTNDGDVAEAEGVDDPADLARALRTNDELETVVRRETPEGPRDFLLHAGTVDEREGEGYLTYTDVTEQKRRQRELRRRTDRVERVANALDGEVLDRLDAVETALEDAGCDAEDVQSVREDVRRLVEELREVARGDGVPDDPDPEDAEVHHG